MTQFYFNELTLEETAGSWGQPASQQTDPLKNALLSDLRHLLGR